MINNEEFGLRLKKVIEYYQLSASSFAEKIKVQRSSISHLLSGRNKPSLDFVLKVLEEFKEVELYWLLNGTGSFPKTTAFDENAAAPTLFSQETVQVSETLEKPTSNANISTKRQQTAKNTIERIVIFYTNGQFKEYVG